MNVDTSLFSSTADIRFKYKPIDTSVIDVPAGIACTKVRRRTRKKISMK